MCYLPGRFRFRTSRRRLSGSNSRPGGVLQSISLKRGTLSLIEPLTHSPDHCNIKNLCRFQMFQNQVGIVSYGGECGEEHSPGVYARCKYFKYLLNISSVSCFSGNVSWIMIFLFTIQGPTVHRMATHHHGSRWLVARCVGSVPLSLYYISLLNTKTQDMSRQKVYFICVDLVIVVTISNVHQVPNIHKCQSTEFV